MSEFHFLRPLWLLALPLTLGLLWWLFSRELKSRSWQSVCDPVLLPYLLLGRSRRLRNWPLYLLGLVQILAIIALSGPVWEKLPRPLFKEQSALVILLDLSNSMLAEDVKPSRLVRARLKAEDILETRREGYTALVGFAGDAFAITPLTDDRQTIVSLLRTLDPSLMPAQGSRIDRAIEEGVRLFSQAGLSRGQLILITDDDEPEYAVTAARKALAAGYRLSILGVGTSQGAPVPQKSGGFLKDSGGQVVLPQLKATALGELAGAARGEYRTLSTDESDIKALLGTISNREIDAEESKTERMGDTWREEGVWLLWPLAVLSSLAFRRGWLALVLLLYFGGASDANALEWKDLWQRPNQQASEAFEKGDYDGASAKFDDSRWKAIALYRSDKFEEAAKHLENPQSSDDWYNRGNALAKSGKLLEAVEAYKKALTLSPENEDALANKRIVEEALEKAEQQSEGQEDGTGPEPQDGQEDQKGGNPGSEEQTPSGSSADKVKEGSASEDQPSGDNISSAEERIDEQLDKEDSGSQQEEDGRGRDKEAQEVRNDEGDSENSDGVVPSEGVSPELSSEEEEALEQWLRRIPDDPGGLLRRKFIYQYSQRDGKPEGGKKW